MLKNYFLSAIRAIARQKTFSLINIFGLGVGISVSLMLFLFIQHELGYDDFHENHDRLFRVVSKYTTNNGRIGESGIAFGSVVPEMKKDIPEVSHATRIYNAGGTDVVYDQKPYSGQGLLYVDHDFFELFSFSPQYGSKVDPLIFNQSGVVISQALATTLFGDEMPIGKSLKLDGEAYEVLEVVKVPERSHIQFDVLLSLEQIEDLNDWAYHSGLDFHSYGLYAPNTDHQQVNAKISQLYNKQMDERFSDFISGSDNYVQAFGDIYLRSEHINNNLGNGSIKTIYILAAIDLLILFIAVVNYINLTTAQYERRIKEIGVRKVIGANRHNLVLQFLGESVLLTLLAFALALGLTELLFEPFSQLMQIDAVISYWSAPEVLAVLLVIVVGLGLISGLYPALFISAFSPTRILKRNFGGMKRGTKGSRILVTLQFAIAIVLVLNLAFLNTQLRFVKNKGLGFDSEQVAIVNNLTPKQKEAFSSIRAALLSSPNIVSVSGSQSALGSGTSGQTVYLKGEDPKTAQPIGELRTVPGFIGTHDIPLMQGRDFSEERVTDKEAFLMNESGVAMLFPNGEDPIGQIIHIAGRVGPIIGVVSDFHYTHLKRAIGPLVLSLDDPYRLNLSIKLNANDVQASLEHIEASLQQVDPEYQLGYYFLDDYFANMFKADERNAALVQYSSLVAALISLVGLIALISHSLHRRMKEVAIRKVLGAHFVQLLWTLTKEFYWVILIANLLAIPVTVWVAKGWLSAFAYRISLADYWLIFGAVALLSFAVALLMILNQVIRRTRANPATVLANE